jgi:hypothetical protein
MFRRLLKRHSNASSRWRKKHLPFAPRDNRPVPIEKLPRHIRLEAESYLRAYALTPASRLRPKLGMNGDIWLAVVGPSVQEGVTGFGSSPVAALRAFNRNYTASKPDLPP